MNLGAKGSALGTKRNAYRILMGRPRLRGRIILKWIINQDGSTWTGFIWLRIDTSGGLL
jgi:hypothetical protein